MTTNISHLVTMPAVKIQILQIKIELCHQRTKKPIIESLDRLRLFQTLN